MLLNTFKKEKLINYNYLFLKYNSIFFECKEIVWCSFIDLATFDELENILYIEQIPKEKILYYGYPENRKWFENSI